jgi:hypothetical protein
MADWIKCSERLPEIKGAYWSDSVVVAQAGKSYACKLMSNGWFYQIGTPHENGLKMFRAGKDCVMGEIGGRANLATYPFAEYWQPLPDPPKESR